MPHALLPRLRALRGLLVQGVVFVAVGLLVYWPFFDPGEPDAVGRYDVFRQFGPWSYFFDRALQAGEFPTWNPLSMLGMPFAANPQAWAFYPPNLARALLHTQPTPAGTVRGLAVLVGLHLFLMASGSFALARRHGLSPVASMLVFVAVAFNAAALRRAVEMHFVFTLAWLPFLLLGVRRLTRARSLRERGLTATATAGFAGLALLGGFPQIYAYLALGVACYWVALRLAARPPIQRPAAVLGGDMLALAFAGLVGAALAMCMLLPAVQYLGLSPRAAGSGVVVDGYSPEAWNVEYVLQSLVLYPGRTWEPETLRGAGVIVLSLALFGLLRGPWRRTLPFALPLYALVDAMVGPPMPLSLAVELTTPFQLVSATRAFDVAILFMALLAGWGLDRLAHLPAWLIRSPAQGPQWHRYAGPAAFVVSVGSVLSLFFWKLPIVALKHSDYVWVSPVTFAAIGGAWLLLGLLGGRAGRGRLGAVLLGAVMVVTVVAEIGLWCRDYTPRLVVQRGHQRSWTDRYGYTGQEPLWDDNFRRTTTVQNYHLFGLEGVMNGYDPFHLHETKRVVGQPGQTHKYRRSLKETELPQRNVFGHLFAKRALWLVPRVSTAAMPLDDTPFAPTDLAFVAEAAVPVGFPTEAGPPEARWLSRDVDVEPLKVPRPARRMRGGKRQHRYRFGRLQNPGRRHSALRLSYRSPTRATVFGYAYERPGGTRRARDLLFRTRLAASQGPAEATIALPDMREFDLRLDVALDQGREFELLSASRHLDRADAGALLDLKRRTADTLEVAVGPLPGQRLLAFIDADFPGWQVSVNGESANLVRVNRGFKGVFLPPGESLVRFRFRSDILRLGVAISGVAFALLIGLLLYCARDPRGRGSGTR